MTKEKVLDLANKIAGTKRGDFFEVKPEDPEYRILDPFVTDDMAEVALYLQLGRFHTAEEVAAQCQRPVEEVACILSRLAMDGVIFSITQNNIDRYGLMIWYPGVMELMVMNEPNRQKYPQIEQFFVEHALRDAEKFAGNAPIGSGGMRVIPVQSAIEAESRRASYEEVNKYLNDNDVFAVSDCQCRTAARILVEGCGHPLDDLCLTLGLTAAYNIRTGRARQVTREEAFAIIDRAEKEGLVHQIFNTMKPGTTTTICNCCGCSCLSLRNSTLYRNSDRIRSNYVAQVDRDNCVACGECVENCQVNALTLGQNLCTREPMALKVTETPFDTEWGLDKWNPGFHHRCVVNKTGTSPCKSECPAHIAVQGYIKMASQGRYKEALELIKKENPFPAICGRVCPRKCESACTRADLDDPIAIDEIKKYIADQDLTANHRFVPEKKSLKPHKIAVVGAGPAGLSCAYFLAVEGYQVTVFEKQNVLGGMLTLGIPSFRLGKEIINAEIDILKELSVEFKTGVEIGKDLTIPQLRKMGYQAFYIAIGAQGSRRLDLEGEEAQGVIHGIDFLRKVNLNDDVQLEGSTIVIGGGNVAIDVARTAARISPSPVSLYCLERRDEMPALDEEVEELIVEGIEMNNTWGPRRILHENGIVVGVEFQKCLSVFDAAGNFNPQFNENETQIVKANNVMIAVGQEMDWGQLIKGLRIDLNPNKTAVVEGLSYQTGEPDIFAGGDAVTGPKFAIDAIALGKQGAISIHRYVNGDNLTLSREREYHALDKDNLNLSGYDRLPRQRPLPINGIKAKATFEDLRTAFTEDQIRKETERCLGCGAVVVDQYQCVGCGICTTKCKFGAISLQRKYDNPSVAPQDLQSTIMNYTMERRQRIAEKQARNS